MEPTEDMWNAADPKAKTLYDKASPIVEAYHKLMHEDAEAASVVLSFLVDKVLLPGGVGLLAALRKGLQVSGIAEDESTAKVALVGYRRTTSEGSDGIAFGVYTSAEPNGQVLLDAVASLIDGRPDNVIVEHGGEA